MYCRKCDMLVSGGRYHGMCGTELISAKLTCPHCQNETWMTAKFCIFCGRPVQEVINQIRKGGK